jgi:glycine/D-amino acid oxidase-like deaminating enzyme
MPTSSTVVVVGAGVIGLSAAYHLARRGDVRVVVLEKDTVGSGSSLRAAGITTGLLWSEVGVRCRKLGIEWFRRLSDELEGYRYHDEHGCLNLFTSISWPARGQLLPLYDRLGVPYEILQGSEIHRRWPALKPPAEFVGLLDPHGGYSEPDEYMPALLNACRALGVDVREGNAVTALVTMGGRVRGLRTRDGDIVEADAVISGVHAWANRLWAPAGVCWPVKSFVRQRYLSSPTREPLLAPAVNADPCLGYLRPARGNRLLIGAETPDREECTAPDTDFTMDQLSTPNAVRDEAAKRLAAIAPAVAEAPWERASVGLTCFSMDGEPILGPVGALPGLFVAGAFHSGGFSYNTVAGVLLAEMIADGRTSIDVSSFSPDRFDRQLASEYLAELVRQSAAVRRRH